MDHRGRCSTALEAAWRLHLRRQVRDPALRRSCARTTRSAASGSCSPTTGTRRSTATTSTSSPRRSPASSPAGSARPTARCTRPTWSSGAPGSRRPTSSARSRSPAAAAPTWAGSGREGAHAPPRDRRPGVPQPVLRLRPQHQPRRQLDHRHARGAGRLDRPGRPPDRRRPDRRAYEVRRRSSRAYDREMQPASATASGRRATTGTPTAGGSPRTGPAWSRSTSRGCARSTGRSCRPPRRPMRTWIVRNPS